MKRNTQAALLIAAALSCLLGIAGSLLWSRLISARQTAVQVPPAAVQAGERAGPTSEDPQLLNKIKEAYRQVLASNSPPGMLEMLDSRPIPLVPQDGRSRGQPLPVPELLHMPHVEEASPIDSSLSAGPGREQSQGSTGVAASPSPGAATPGEPQARLGIPSEVATDSPLLASRKPGASGTDPESTEPPIVRVGTAYTFSADATAFQPLLSQGTRTGHPVSSASSIAAVSSSSKKEPVEPLTGTYPAEMENGSQLVLPEEVRCLLGEVKAVYVTPGPDGCLCLAAPAVLKRLAARLVRGAKCDEDARKARRLFLARTARGVLDRDGRLDLPRQLTEAAGLGGSVLVIGAGDHFEIWDAGRWEEYSNRPAFDASPASRAPGRTAGWGQP